MYEIILTENFQKDNFTLGKLFSLAPMVTDGTYPFIQHQVHLNVFYWYFQDTWFTCLILFNNVNSCCFKQTRQLAIKGRDTYLSYKHYQLQLLNKVVQTNRHQHMNVDTYTYHEIR